MKTPLLRLGLALACALWAPAAEASTIFRAPTSLGLAQGLVGYWSFEGKTVAGTRVFDASGTGNYGTMTNGPTLVNGKLGQAMQFDGGDDYVNVSGTTQYVQASAPFTVSAWVYLRKFNGTAYQHIATLRSNGCCPYELLFSNDNGGSYLGFAIGSQDTFTPFRTGTPVADMLSKWIHVVATYNGNGAGTAANYAAYMNNVPQTLVASGAFGGGKAQQTAIAGYSGVTAGESWDGLLDDVRIYNRALSADEIKRLYKIGATAKLGVAAANDSLATGLVGWWNFDGKTVAGTRVFDASGTGNYGTMTNGPTLVYGKIGQGMEFDGSDDYVDLASTDGFSTGSGATWTLVAWAKTDVLNSNYHFIVGYGDGTTGTSPHIQLDNLNHWQTSTYGNDLSGPPAVKGQWTHVVGVGSGTTLRLYIDGQQYASTVVTNAPVTTRARIGTDMGASPALNFNGILDDVRIYNRALSADEVKRLYMIGAAGKLGVAANNNSLAKGLVGYWTFDGKDMAGNSTAGEYAFDKSSNGNRGTLTNGPTRVFGKIGQGLQFDGMNDYVSLPNTSSLNIATDITMVAWVKTRTTLNLIIGGYENAAGFPGYGLRTGIGGNFDYWSGAHGSWVGSNSAINDNSWHHIAVVVSGTTARFYKDGVPDGVVSTQVPDSFSGTRAIGALSNGTANFFPGLIDDIRVYNRALSPDEIKRLYTMGR